MAKRGVSYQEVLRLVEQLTPVEQAQLLDELRDRLLGFGMWSDRREMEDIKSYVEELRAEESSYPGRQLKTPQEFWRDLESWNE